MLDPFHGTGFKPFMDAFWEVEDRIQRIRKRKPSVPDPIRIAGIDPGTLSGLAQLWVDPASGRVKAWIETILAYNERQQVLDMNDWLGEVEGRTGSEGAHLAIEDFRVNKINGTEEFLSPVRIGRRLEGMLMVNGSCFDGHIHWNMPSRKAEFSDERLQALKLYTPGPDHRRDATRHAMIARKYALQERGI